MQAGMIIVCLSIVAVGFLPQLPSPGFLLGLSLLALIAFLLRRFLLLIPLCLGMVWASLYGYLGLAQQLPGELEGHDLWVEGTVSGLPKMGPRAQRFDFDIESVEAPKVFSQQLRLKKVRLNWYELDKPVRPGERWRLLLRLKRPHGFANPGGFDYEGWLFRHGIGATGYVRRDEGNRRLQAARLSHLLDQWRYRLLTRLQAQLDGNPQQGYLLALIMGERSDINDRQWQLLSATGTNHLFVISGLHVGFVALCGYWLFFMVSRWFLWGPPRIAAQHVGVSGALLLSSAYAALAGFSLPTQRALIMLLVMLVSRLCYRQGSVWYSFVLALFAVLLWDPLAGCSAGFWLSFGAVGVLLYAFGKRTDSRGFYWRWLRPQWVVFVAFVPVLLFFFQQASLVSPVANVLAIPLVGLVIVPLCLLVVLLQILGDAFSISIFQLWAGGLLELASYCLQWVFAYLQVLADLSWANWKHALSIWWLLPVLPGVLLLLAPRGLPGRWLGVLCFLPLFASNNFAPTKGAFEVTVLDVGQGLAVLVRTEAHQLLYDTGARFSDQLDAASAVILPFLRQAGIETLDRVVVSHGDNDHAGALPPLLEQVPVRHIISGASELQAGGVPITKCQSGDDWSWDGVRFEVMQADAITWRNENNRSCVLRISNGQHSVLLTGDIEVEAEAFLVGRYGVGLKSDVLLAPHHGSLTSSGEDFIEAVAPGQVIFSSGYRNRFGHPHEKVVARYQRRGIAMLNTAESGAIRLYSDNETRNLQLEKYRQSFRRYWF